MSEFSDASRVKLKSGSLFAESEKIGIAYIKSIDVDRLLAPSYQMHNLTAPNGKERYGGWERRGANNWISGGGDESFTLAGHSLGHWLSAAAAAYNDTADTELSEKLSYAVGKLYELQTQTGSPYIGGCPEDTFKLCFAGQKGWSHNYWVPWYGIHKIYQGLIDAYLYCDRETSKTAFKVLVSFADWAVDGTDSLNDLFMQEMLDVEYGGMNEIFALMYKFTHNNKYLNTARRFTHDKILNPLAEGEDKLSGLHANTQIPKIIGAAALYEQAPEEYASYRKASESFWRFVVENRSYAIGGNSIAEHFENKGLESLGIKTCESCNTYNMMRLTEYLFAWEHNSEYMDWYEDALFNHILGQQEPETGAKMYFVSLLQGHHRVYEEKDKSWWCCTGTGMENPVRYTKAVYYEDENDLYVNLYMSNDYEWQDKGLKFSTETDYPYSGVVKMTVTEGNAKANIKLRVPVWCDGMLAKISGVEYRPQGGYISINRNWSKGDKIDIDIPMKIRTYYSRTGAHIAYKYGPVTLAAPLGACGCKDGVHEYISNETRIDSVTAEVPYIITNNEEPESFVRYADKNRLVFIVPAEYSSNGKDIILKPFFEIHHEFYSVYFNLNSEADKLEKALNDVTIDKIEPDGQQDELGHGLLTNTPGPEYRGTAVIDGKNYMYRCAWGDTDELPYFSYNLEVKSGVKNYAAIAVCGTDEGFAKKNVIYNVFADEEKIGEVKNNRRNKTEYKFFELPLRITDKKTSITIKLQAADASSCALMLEMRTTSDIIYDI